MNPALNADTAWHLGSIFVSLTLAALFLGRTDPRLRSYFASAGNDGAAPLGRSAA